MIWSDSQRTTITGRNLQKAFVISFKTGIRLPKYGLRLITEQILVIMLSEFLKLAGWTVQHHREPYLGTRNSASKERMSNEISIIISLPLARPIIPGHSGQWLVLKASLPRKAPTLMIVSLSEMICVLAIRKAIPVPIIPRSHKLQKSVSVFPVSDIIRPDGKIEIDDGRLEALPKRHELRMSEIWGDSMAKLGTRTIEEDSRVSELSKLVVCKGGYPNIPVVTC